MFELLVSSRYAQVAASLQCDISKSIHCKSLKLSHSSQLIAHILGTHTDTQTHSPRCALNARSPIYSYSDSTLTLIELEVESLKLAAGSGSVAQRFVFATIDQVFNYLQVIWFKDTMQLDTTERHIMENRGSRHTLIIRKVHPQDFGNYSCVAENQLGKSRKTLQLSGKPNVAVFNSPAISQYKDR